MQIPRRRLGHDAFGQRRGGRDRIGLAPARKHALTRSTPGWRSSARRGPCTSTAARRAWRSTTPDGVQLPDTMYWPRMFGERFGILRSELRYFANCVKEGRTPDRITPEESRAAVEWMVAATKSRPKRRDRSHSIDPKLP